MLKKNFRISLVVTLIIVIVGLFMYPWGSYDMLRASTKHEVGTYTEDVQEGKKRSEVNNIFNIPLQYYYKLSEDIEEPFAASFIHFDSAQVFPFCEYDFLKLTIKAQEARKIPITITLNRKGFTKKGNADFTSIPYNVVINYTGPGDYYIKKEDFKIQSWWLRHHGFSPEEFEEPNYCDANYMVFGSCQALEKGKEDIITISAIEFSNYGGNHILFFVSLGTLFHLIFWSVVFVKKKKTKLVTVLVDKSETNTAQNIKEQVIHYISQEYKNSELSQEDIAKALGITSRKIGSILKDEFGLGFKAYLNKIRLSAVTHLLKETEEPVSQIAYDCGYNNISHFNRVFKEAYGVSPQGYREGAKG
jgi:AraC-like DNA-binding protein